MAKNGKSGAGKGSSAKKGGAPAKKAPAKKNTNLLIIAAIVVVVAVVAVVAANSGSKGSTATAGASGSSGSVPAEEAKYIGRFLPAGYTEPNVGASTKTGATSMIPVQAKQTDAGLELAVNDVLSNRDVSFEYTNAKGEKVPMIAYVKPSGKLFVGVSYCVPCKGTGQSIADDGTLTCDSCGTKRDLETGVGISGACKLYPLDEMPVKVAGGKISIDKAALDGWTVQPTDRPIGG